MFHRGAKLGQSEGTLTPKQVRLDFVLDNLRNRDEQMAVFLGIASSAHSSSYAEPPGLSPAMTPRIDDLFGGSFASLMKAVSVVRLASCWCSPNRDLIPVFPLSLERLQRRADYPDGMIIPKSRGMAG
jgi:hypothetical protein